MMIIKFFKDLNFEINKGQKIGFKSKSGSGKSTFIFLMLEQSNRLRG